MTSEAGSATDTGSDNRVARYFCDLMQSDAELSAAIAAMKTLLMVLEETNCTRRRRRRILRIDPIRIRRAY